MHFNNAKTATRKILDNLTRVLPSWFWIIIIFAFDTASIAILTLICATIHELGHITVFRLMKKENKLSSNFSGLRLSEYGPLSYKEEATVAISGPLFNVFAAGISLIFHNYMNGYMTVFAILNILTAASNLLPITGYDGSKILSCFLASHLSDTAAYTICSVISFLLCVLFSVFSLYLISRLDAGYFIFFVFFGFLIKNFKL